MKLSFSWKSSAIRPPSSCSRRRADRRRSRWCLATEPARLLSHVRSMRGWRGRGLRAHVQYGMPSWSLTTAGSVTGPHPSLSAYRGELRQSPVVCAFLGMVPWSIRLDTTAGTSHNGGQQAGGAHGERAAAPTSEARALLYLPDVPRRRVLRTTRWPGRHRGAQTSAFPRR